MNKHFSKMLEEIESKEFELFKEKLSYALEKAYMEGVEEGRTKFNYPPVLTKAHLCEIFQTEMPTVSRLVARPDFPKLTVVRARYPRDQVFEWIERNSNLFIQQQYEFKTS